MPARRDRHEAKFSDFIDRSPPVTIRTFDGLIGQIDFASSVRCAMSV